MIFKSTLVALLATSVGFMANAQDTTSGETSTKVESRNAVEGNLDNEITNNKMRAESGSKSKYSMSLDTNYFGGTVKEPFDTVRADLLGGTARPAVLLSTDISGRYRVTKNTSINGGIGVTLIQPFHAADKSPVVNPATGERQYRNYEQKVEPTSPFIKVSHYRKMGNWMVSGGATTTIYTEERFTDADVIADFYTDGTGLYSFKNGLQLGLNAGVGTQILGSDARDLDADVVDFYLSVNPFAEYVMTDMFNLRTVWNFGLNHLRNNVQGESRYQNGLTRQSFGLGIAVNRDVFLYPNVQISTRNFYSEVDADQTTVGFNATINIF